MYVKGTKVYYNKSVVTTVIRPLFAGIINEDACDMSEITDASWFGDLFKTSYAIDSPSHYTAIIDRIFVLQSKNNSDNTAGWEGATIKVVGLTTATIGITLGILPES